MAGLKPAVEPPAEKHGLAALWPALVIMGLGIAGLGIATAFSDGVPGQFVVVAPPFGTGVLEIVAAADGALVASGGFSNVMIAASDRADFAADLRRAGALMVFPAPRFLGCSSPTDIGS